MAICSIEFPSEIDELEESGLATVESQSIAPPRIRDAPVQFECKKTLSLSLGGVGRTLIVGEVTIMHIAEHLVDPKNLHIDQANLGLVGRAGSGGWYMRTSDRFRVEEPTLEEWESRRQKLGADPIQMARRMRCSE